MTCKFYSNINTAEFTMEPELGTLLLVLTVCQLSEFCCDWYVL